MGLYLSGFDPSLPASAVLTSVAQSATSVILIAANSSRRYASIYNSGTKTLFVAFGPTASVTAFTVQIPTNGYLELQEDGYTGDVSGIWAGAGGGAAKVTEVS